VTSFGAIIGLRSAPAAAGVLERDGMVTLSISRTAAGLGVGVLLAVALTPPLDARQGAGACRISGRAASGTTPLPGVAIAIRTGDITHATSTETDGGYSIAVPPGQYTLSAELTGFSRVQQPLVVTAGDACAQTVNLALALAPRQALAVTPRATPQGAPTATIGGRGAPAPGAAARGRGAPAGFESLQVQPQADATAAQPTTAAEQEADIAATRLLLPPGFSTDAPADAITISGNMASIDRGMMNDRFGAIGRGEFDPATGEFGAGFGGDQGRGGPGGFGGRGGPGGGRGDGGGRGPGGRGGPGGPFGPGGFQLGGRGGQQQRYNATTSYSFGGSALDSAPYQLRADSAAGKNPYTRQTYGGTVGGPVKIPHLYDGTRRTNFTISYNGNHGSSAFDQYATVPTAAMRAGDYAAGPVTVIDPATHQPFPGNRIPAARIDPAAQALLRFIPLPNLPGDTRNFHNTSTTQSSLDNVNVRVTHNFTPAVAGGGGGGRGGGGFGGGGGGFGGAPRGAAGRGGRGAAQGTSVNLTAQLQVRRSDDDRLNVLPALGGRVTTRNVAVPIVLNIRHKRTMQTINLNVSTTSAKTTNRYAGVDNVTADAGIAGVSTDPFDWGVPSLSFSSLSSVRDVTPSRRADRRISAAYSWTLPHKQHQFRLGGDVRFDRTSSQTDANAAGAFVFTGLYAAGGSPIVRGGGLDFADFLLGLPQQASVQYGPGTVRMTGTSMSLFAQDDWRRSAKLTLSLGVRYELIFPFVERAGRMANLDVPGDFTAAAPVLAGASGPFTGRFPAGLLNPDVNNIAPRVGAAWRITPGTVLRGGYGISFNSGSYATIARQLATQPPFSVSDTVIGTALAPLLLANAFAAPITGVSNSYGVDKHYALGRVQTWNADLSRDLTASWNVGGGYTRTTGASLDLVRAPNRGPSGLRIAGVQPFLWQTSEGTSVLNALTLRVQRRLVKGIGGNASYTLAKSRDDASNIGGGATVVAQDDRNLAAEYGLSSFDRRHQLAADLSVELPFGSNKHWLHGGGRLASVFGNWRTSANVTWQSGTPFTPRVTSAASDVARGTNGTLRADYLGGPIRIAGPTIDRFFNTDAFAVPLPGTFGNASRNMIIGPGSRQLNAQLSRDVPMRHNRTVTIQATASNLLNAVNYAAIDTVVNSPTFGEVLSVRAMRSAQLNIRFRF
jgi:trimeric autotransporter adhesin